MASSAGLVEWLLEALEPVGGVIARRMFGGHGLFRRGLMFCLVARDAAYLKVDEGTRPEFEATGSQPFTYSRGGKPATLGYWLVPAAVLDDPEALCAWAERAFAVALRAKRGA
jgi:DNA transformation protein